MEKETKNMAWYPTRAGEEHYRNMDINITLQPPLVEKHLRQCAAGKTIDSMKHFMAKALMLCMSRLNVCNNEEMKTLLDIRNMAWEVDLEFADMHVEAAPSVNEPEGGTDTGVTK